MYRYSMVYNLAKKSTSRADLGDEVQNGKLHHVVAQPWTAIKIPWENRNIP